MARLEACLHGRGRRDGLHLALLILAITPEADLRVDLLLIGPLLDGLGLGALVPLVERLWR